jgi:hypothetical protein
VDLSRAPTPLRVNQALASLAPAPPNGFKNVRNSLPGSIATWAFNGRAHYVTQDHPVYIPRDLGSSAPWCSSPPSGLPLPTWPGDYPVKPQLSAGTYLQPLLTSS